MERKRTEKETQRMIEGKRAEKKTQRWRNRMEKEEHKKRQEMVRKRDIE
jgi:hypothetical protein